MRNRGSQSRPDRARLALIVAVAAVLAPLAGAGSARAFDFFGLFGSDDSPPAVSKTAIAYKVTIEAAGGVKSAVMDARPR